MTHTDAYERIAKSALNQYGVVHEELRFLGHSGNVTFYVEARSEKFLLRIHQAFSGLEDDIWLRPDVIESELLWLAALRHQTNIIVQEPVQNLDCGFGYYLYDIAESIQYLLPQVRFSFFEGYQTIRNLPDRYLEIVEGFFIMAIIYNYSFLLKNPEEHKWISDDIRHIANRHLRKYLEGKSFLLESQETPG